MISSTCRNTCSDFRVFERRIEDSAASLSPDGRYALSGGGDGTIKLYDIERKKELVSRVHIGEKDWVVYTPDGRFDGTPEGIPRLHFVKGQEMGSEMSFDIHKGLKVSEQSNQPQFNLMMPHVVMGGNCLPEIEGLSAGVVES